MERIQYNKAKQRPWRSELRKQNTLLGKKEARRPSHMPRGSIFYEKIIPILLAGMALVTVGLLLFAAAVVLGVVEF